MVWLKSSGHSHDDDDDDDNTRLMPFCRDRLQESGARRMVKLYESKQATSRLAIDRVQESAEAEPE